MAVSLKLNPTWCRYIFLLHGIGWAGYLVIIILLWNLGAVDTNPASLIRFVVTVGVILPGVFYANILVLIPRFFQKRLWMKWFFWHLILVFMIALFEMLIATVGEGSRVGDTVFPAFQSGFLWILLLTSIAFVYRYLIDGIAMPMRMEGLQAERDAAQLAFLKSQVDPHFLFNTLNNLYALSLEEEAPQTADSIALLARLMRYSLHDAQADTILLEKEVQYLETYVALQRLRALERVCIEFVVNVSQEDLRSFEVAPMLLIPFVENAFKYGIHASKTSSVKIQLGVERNVLTMNCANTIVRPSDHQTSGKVGYTNVRQRLARLYPDVHSLDIKNDGHTYAVHLQVHL